MQHIGQSQVVDEAAMAEHLVGNVQPLHWLACDRALGDRLGPRARRRIAVERDFAGQLPIAGPDIAWPRYRAVLDIECIGLDAELVRRRSKEDVPDLGAGRPDRTTRL